MNAVKSMTARTIPHSTGRVCGGVINRRMQTGRLINPNQICTNTKVFQSRMTWTGLKHLLLWHQLAGSSVIFIGALMATSNSMMIAMRITTILVMSTVSWSL